MLVKFKSATLEARVKMDAVPKVGDVVSINGDLYGVEGKIKWSVKAGDDEQTVVVSIRPFNIKDPDEGVNE